MRGIVLPWRCRARTIIAINCLVALVAAAAGGCLGVAGLGRAPMLEPAFASMAAYVGILGNNERVLVLMLIGLPLMGLYGNVVVVANCFRYGMVSAFLARANPQMAVLLSLHAPLELLVFAIGAGAVQGASLDVVGAIMDSTRYRFRTWGIWFLTAAALLPVVAALEVLSIWLRQSIR